MYQHRLADRGTAAQTEEKREKKRQRERERDDVKAEKQRLGNSEQGEGVMKMARERGRRAIV